MHMYFDIKFTWLDRKIRNDAVEPRHSYAFSGRA